MPRVEKHKNETFDYLIFQVNKGIYLCFLSLHILKDLSITSETEFKNLNP